MLPPVRILRHGSEIGESCPGGRAPLALPREAYDQAGASVLSSPAFSIRSVTADLPASTADLTRVET